VIAQKLGFFAEALVGVGVSGAFICIVLRDGCPTEVVVQTAIGGPLSQIGGVLVGELCQGSVAKRARSAGGPPAIGFDMDEMAAQDELVDVDAQLGGEFQQG
jgi:hypothetical protein